MGLGADFHRRSRQVGHVPAAYLAARRDGGPDAGIGADPCRDDGRGRRLSGGPAVPRLLFRGSRGVARHRLSGRIHVAVRRGDRLRADRYQARARVLDHFADRFHDGRSRRVGLRRTRGARLHGRHVSPVHARDVQGAAVPRRGSHYPCRAQQRDEPHGRFAQADARDARHVPDRLPRYRRHSSVLGILQQGRDSGRHVRVQHAAGLVDEPDGRSDGLLHVSSLL